MSKKIKKGVKEKFPKKAKLISDGGLYRIIDIEKFIPRIELPITRRIILNDPEIYWQENWRFNLTFDFVRVKGKYANYYQVDFIKLESK